MPTIQISRDYSTSKNIKLFMVGMKDGLTVSSVAQGSVKSLPNLPKKTTETTPEGIYYLFNRLPNLQDIPDLAGAEGGDTDTIEITTLQDAYHEFADGLKNRGDNNSNSLTFNFLYDKGVYEGIQIAINTFNRLAGESSKYYQILYVVLPDGSYFAMRVKSLSTVFSGVGVNSALTFQFNVAIDGDVEWNEGGDNSASMFASAGELNISGNNSVNAKWMFGEESSGSWHWSYESAAVDTVLNKEIFVVSDN